MTNLTDQTDQWPYSTEAEIGVLAALLHDNSLWDEISDLLTAKDFHLQSHAASRCAQALLAVSSASIRLKPTREWSSMATCNACQPAFEV